MDVMTYKWRATFSFDYPLLDQPVDIGDIRLCPAPPELDLDPHAIHYYEFETSTIDRSAQQDARKKYLARLEKLAELSVLAPYYTEVSFHSLVLLDSDKKGGYPSSGINLVLGGKPYAPPGQSPKKFREQLMQSAQTFVNIQSLKEEIQEPISRTLRWIYRGSDYRLSSDDKLIYRWIAFNSLYSTFNTLNGVDLGERSSVIGLEEYFRSSVGSIKDGAQQLAASGLQLDRGKDRDVSSYLQQSLASGDNLLTRRALECVYAARCSLFHGAEKPALHVSNLIMSVSADYLDSYLKKVIPPFVVYCKQYS
jgi:hypothetical protein